MTISQQDGAAQHPGVAAWHDYFTSKDPAMLRAMLAEGGAPP